MHRKEAKQSGGAAEQTRKWWHLQLPDEWARAWSGSGQKTEVALVQRLEEVEGSTT